MCSEESYFSPDNNGLIIKLFHFKNIKMRKITILALSAVALILSACNPKDNATKINDKTIYVKTISVGNGDATTAENYIGVVEEDVSASVSFPVNGNVQRITIEEGQEVKKGALLAELDADNLQSTYDAAKAMLDQAEDGMARLQKLYDRNSIPEIKYIEMQTNLEKARAAEAIAKTNLKNSRLTAPFDGVVGDVLAEVGENVLPNQAVLTLMQIGVVKVKVTVPEKEINTFEAGQQVTVNVSAVGDKTYSGEVSKKGVVADRISHSYPVRITVENPDNVLLPGMIANVCRQSERSQSVLVVPNQCVMTDGNGQHFVWKVVDGKAQKQTVTIGQQKTNGVAITEGLNAGDNVVTEGYQKLLNGLKVAVL